MTQHRVVVTGVGAVSPLGLDVDEHFQRLLAGDVAVGRSETPVASEPAAQLAARVVGFDRRAMVKSRTLRKIVSENAGHCVAAATQVLTDAGLHSEHQRLQGCGLYIGSPAINIDPELFIPALRASLDADGQFDMQRFAQRGMRLLDPLFLVKALPNIGLGGMSVQHQILSANANITNGFTSGLQAVAVAASAVRRGEIDCAVAGGYDSLLSMDSVAENLIQGRLSSGVDEPARACRPFDVDRDGHVVSEGAALVFLESETSARARGATIYGEVLAVGHTTDPHAMVDADRTEPLFLQKAAQIALDASGRIARDVAAIFGDGLATASDDLREACAVRCLLEDAPVPVTAATGAMGYTGAVHGVFSLLHALLALRHGEIPPLTNCHTMDPRCGLAHPSQRQPLRAEHLLVLNSDRGRKNVALLLGAAGARG